MPGTSFLSRYGFTIVTLCLFAVALVGQWLFGWYEYAAEQRQHQQAVVFSEYFVQLMRGTLENWQSEFLQLVWQVAGLSFLLHVGSTQSREGQDRVEEKVDALLRALPGGGSKIEEIDRRYARK